MDLSEFLNDEESGLYYLNARMYDPTIARFLQKDTYTGDKNDPTGQWLQFLDDAAKAVGGFVDEAKIAISEPWNGFKSKASATWESAKKTNPLSTALINMHKR